MISAEACVFVKQSREPFHCGLVQDRLLHLYLRHPFFRSYGASLPSSLTRVLSRALGYSPRLPVSDCGTDMWGTSHEDFLGSVVRPLRLGFPGLVFRSRLSRWIYLPGNAYLVKPTLPVVGWFTFLRPSLGDNDPTWFWNINQMPFIYAFRPRLRTD